MFLFFIFVELVFEMFSRGRLYPGFRSNPYPVFPELLDRSVLTRSIINLLKFFILFVALCLFNPPKAEKKRRKVLFYFYLLDVVAVSALFRSIRS